MFHERAGCGYVDQAFGRNSSPADSHDAALRVCYELRNMIHQETFILWEKVRSKTCYKNQEAPSTMCHVPFSVLRKSMLFRMVIFYRQI